MSAPERRDGLARLQLELTEGQATGLWSDAHLGASVRQAMKMGPTQGATTEDHERARKLLINALTVEQSRGGLFDSGTGENFNIWDTAQSNLPVDTGWGNGK